MIAFLPFSLRSYFHLKCKLKLYSLYSGETLFTSLEAGYLEQCANNLKVSLIAADTPNKVYSRQYSAPVSHTSIAVFFVAH